MEEQNKQNKILKDDVKETIEIEKELKELQENYEKVEENHDSLIKKYKGIKEEEKRLEENNESISKRLRISELSTKGEIKELKLELDRMNKEITIKQKRLEELEKGIEPKEKKEEQKTVEQKDKKQKPEEKESSTEKDKTKEEIKEEIKEKIKEEIKEEPKEKIEQKEETKTEEKAEEKKKEETKEKAKAKEKTEENDTINRNKLFYDSIYEREDEDEDKEYQIIIDIKRGRAYCFIGGKKEYSEELTETGNSVAAAYNKIINTVIRFEEKIPISNYTEFKHAFKGVSPYVVNILARYNTKQLNQYLNDFYNQERNPDKSKYFIQYRNTNYLKEVPRNLRSKLKLEIQSSREIATSDMKMGLLERLKRLREGKGLQELQTFKQLESRESKEERFRESLRSHNQQIQHEIRTARNPRQINQRRTHRENEEELHK